MYVLYGILFIRAMGHYTDTGCTGLHVRSVDEKTKIMKVNKYTGLRVASS